MRYLLTGILMAGGVAWIAVEARTSDDYYTNHVTRWEHASNAGSAPVVLGSMVVALAIALTFLLLGVFSRRLGALAASCGGTLYVIAWVVAWVGLMGGH